MTPHSCESEPLLFNLPFLVDYGERTTGYDAVERALSASAVVAQASCLLPMGVLARRWFLCREQAVQRNAGHRSPVTRPHCGSIHKNPRRARTPVGSRRDACTPSPPARQTYSCLPSAKQATAASDIARMERPSSLKLGTAGAMTIVCREESTGPVCS